MTYNVVSLLLPAEKNIMNVVLTNVLWYTLTNALRNVLTNNILTNVVLMNDVLMNDVLTNVVLTIV